jgi:DNA-binding beta-propeller fold protein YncE
MVKVGEGSLQYELVEGWEQLPDGWEHRDVAGVATDSQGNAYLFCRGDHPVIIYDREGRFLDSWGEGQFTLRTHGMYIDKNDVMYLTDEAVHKVERYTLDGKKLLTLGTGEPSDTGCTGRDLTSITHGGPPFNRPTNLAVGPDGDLFVSDGYGNCRVHRFADDGELEQSWGDPGSGPGQFMCPHGIWVHTDGRVFVADRENDRIQIFSPTGEYLNEWTGVLRPSQLFIDDKGLVYVAELVRRKGAASFRTGVAEEEQIAGVRIMDLDGNTLLRFGGPDSAAPGNFVAPHDIWVDDRGDIYVAEATWTIGVKSGYVPEGTHSLQKFARI